MVTYEIETELKAQGYTLICGVDEAGRGPLAGPVYAGAVILPAGMEDIGINDSKKLSEKKREILYDKIIDSASAWGIGSASEQEIDEINILNAAMLAMRRAIESMAIRPDFVLADGNRKPGSPYPEMTVVKGDAKSISIAAASILAKVSRDRYMISLSEQYPEFQFDKHKGYPTALHYEMIKQYGILPVHRRSFLKTLDKH
ncbi:MAG: ribonuclease HII [Clostridia bacterium]|nr:ribonuclease HII [Clostridia bacterium]